MKSQLNIQALNKENLNVKSGVLSSGSTKDCTTFNYNKLKSMSAKSLQYQPKTSRPITAVSERKALEKFDKTKLDTNMIKSSSKIDLDKIDLENPKYQSKNMKRLNELRTERVEKNKNIVSYLDSTFKRLGIQSSTQHTSRKTEEIEWELKKLHEPPKKRRPHTARHIGFDKPIKTYISQKWDDRYNISNILSAKDEDIPVLIYDKEKYAPVDPKPNQRKAIEEPPEERKQEQKITGMEEYHKHLKNNYSRNINENNNIEEIDNKQCSNLIRNKLTKSIETQDTRTMMSEMKSRMANNMLSESHCKSMNLQQSMKPKQLDDTFTTKNNRNLSKLQLEQSEKLNGNLGSLQQNTLQLNQELEQVLQDPRFVTNDLTLHQEAANVSNMYSQLHNRWEKKYQGLKPSEAVNPFLSAKQFTDAYDEVKYCINTIMTEKTNVTQINDNRKLDRDSANSVSATVRKMYAAQIAKTIQNQIERKDPGPVKWNIEDLTTKVIPHIKEYPIEDQEKQDICRNVVRDQEKECL